MTLVCALLRTTLAVLLLRVDQVHQQLLHEQQLGQLGLGQDVREEGQEVVCAHGRQLRVPAPASSSTTIARRLHVRMHTDIEV